MTAKFRLALASIGWEETEVGDRRPIELGSSGRVSTK